MPKSRLVTERDDLLDSIEAELKAIYSGDEGPVLRNQSQIALCARRHEVGKLLRRIIRNRSRIALTAAKAEAEAGGEGDG